MAVDGFIATALDRDLLLRGAKRQSNPAHFSAAPGLLRFARDDETARRRSRSIAAGINPAGLVLAQSRVPASAGTSGDLIPPQHNGL
jgi:hypothetical protein